MGDTIFPARNMKVNKLGSSTLVYASKVKQRLGNGGTGAQWYDKFIGYQKNPKDAIVEASDGSGLDGPVGNMVPSCLVELCENSPFRHCVRLPHIASRHDPEGWGARGG